MSTTARIHTTPMEIPIAADCAMLISMPKASATQPMPVIKLPWPMAVMPLPAIVIAAIEQNRNCENLSLRSIPQVSMISLARARNITQVAEEVMPKPRTNMAAKNISIMT